MRNRKVPDIGLPLGSADSTTRPIADVNVEVITMNADGLIEVRLAAARLELPMDERTWPAGSPATPAGSPSNCRDNGPGSARGFACSRHRTHHQPDRLHATYSGHAANQVSRPAARTGAAARGCRLPRVGGAALVALPLEVP